MHRVTVRAIELLNEISTSHVALMQKHVELMSLSSQIPFEDIDAYASATQKIVDQAVDRLYKK